MAISRVRERRTGVRSNRRRRVLLFVLAAAVVVCAGSLAAPLVIKSPAQQAAQARPPAATVLTAPVEYRVLKSAVVLRGTVTPASSVEVNATAGSSEGSPVVTGVRVKTGDRLVGGKVIMEVSGRPVIALLGAIPAYRDLRPGVSGRDVAQLQTALKTLGLDPGEHGAVFGEGTKKAVSALYSRLGYSARTTGAEDQVSLDGARNQVKLAQRALEDAQIAVPAQGQAPKSSGVPGPSPTAAPAGIDGAVQVARATEDLAEAKKALAHLQATTGPMLPVAEVVFVPAFPARVDAVKAKVGAEPESPLLTLSAGRLVVTAHLNPADRELIKSGMPVEITSELLGKTATGKVASVGALAQDENGELGAPLTVRPNKALDGRFADQDVRLSVVSASTDGPVLVVPLSAVSARADGQAVVVRHRADGADETVPVAAGTSGSGYVAIHPTSGALRVGDQVVIGR
jgi:HlyD family secretion protein